MRLEREALTLPRAIAPHQEIFAIGDIHGRADLLEALLDAARREPRVAAHRRIVFLGDLIDRGPESLRSLSLASRAAELSGSDDAISLMGNHETLMRMALSSSIATRDAIDALMTWEANGGDAVIAELLHGRYESSHLARLRLALRDALPDYVARWLESLVPHVRSGGVLFVHAGINPRFPLEDFLAIPWDLPLAVLDERAHWAWVRRPFLEHLPGAQGWQGYFVVHGHTPRDKSYTLSHAEQVQRYRLNLDGGSAMTGAAKMAILRGDFAEVVTARA